MPDTEVQTPAIETPAAPEAVPAPEAKTGPARGKKSEAQRIADAAAELAKIEKKPFDPSKAETPTAEAAPTEKPESTTPAEVEKPLSEQEPTNANYRIWRNRTAKLEKNEAAFKQQKAEFDQRLTRIADVEKQFETWQAEKKLLREDPRAFWAKQAKEHGSDFTKEYERLANAYMDEGKPDAKLDAALKRVDELAEKLAEKERGDTERAQQERERAMIGNFLRDAVGDQHKNTAYTYRKYGEQVVLHDAAAVAESLVAKLGRVPTNGEIVAELDIQYASYYKEIVDSHSGLSQPSQGVAERVNGAEKPAKPAAPQAPKTLTNGGSAERATPARKLTERERIEAATKLLPG